MTSILPEEESNVIRLKQKSQMHNAQDIDKSDLSASHNENRSFLNFSRENLSISNLEFEQGFNKTPRMRSCTRQTLLSCAAMFLALSCAGLELWKLRRGVAVARDVETLKRDVETLKHRFLEKDLLDELKAFEEQLYSEDLSLEDDSSSIPSPNGSDYDSSYEESSTSPSSSTGYQTVASATEKRIPTDSSESGTAFPTVTPCTSKDLEDVLAVLRRAEAERGHTFEERLKLLGEHRGDVGGAKSKRQALGIEGPRRRRDLHKKLN